MYAFVPFEPVESALNLVALEREVLERWRAQRIFEQSLAQREGAPPWVFYEGPPTANGKPGLHHAWARSFKDLFPRFQTMRGHYVARKGGWDCHGLPVELEIEKELGFSGKAQIEEYGIEAFNQRCRESVHRYVADWEMLTERIGMWLDTKEAYWTLSNEYVESVWWLFKQMWDRELIYEGFKVVPYCGRCGTALSSHEVALGYQDLVEPSVYVRFPVVDRDFDLLVWTTTPWTLISNVAAAVGPSIEYVRVRTSGESRDVVISAGRVEAVLGTPGDGVEIVGQVPVSDLVGLHYERPFTFLTLDAGAARVVSAEFVTTEDGSGIVHLAPAFGEVDREVGVSEDLPVLNPVDAAGRFMESVTPYAGLFVKDADAAIIDDLRSTGRLEKVEAYEHSYPHCWRCTTPLIYYAKTSWFARTSSLKREMLAENKSIGWHPEHIRDGRFGDWLENNVDWALSRDRYWGTPLPIWRCTGVDPHDTCVGSVAELAELTGHTLDDLDLHRPFVDDLVVTCTVCQAPARRIEPVLDAWFDSGAMPSAQFHHPFAGSQAFEQRFPADFICEAIDQTRGWFYSLLAVNTLVFGQTPYRNVVCLAHVVDKDGQKMSKSRGNVIDPWTILDTKGADALRWYFFSAGSPWTNRRVYEDGIDESTRRFILTLWNTHSFFVTYANIDNWSPGIAPTYPNEHVLDRWVRSRLHATIQAVTDALEGFDALAGAQSLESFVDDLSNWYVRRSRARFWKSADPAAHSTLHECLLTISKLLAPFCPFVSEALYGNLVAGQGRASVHLEDWPSYESAAVDEVLDAEMALARKLVALGRAARNEAKIRVRQPLARAVVLLPAGETLSGQAIDQISDELNVKRVEVVATLDNLIRYSVTPNFRTLGPRLGPAMPRLKTLLAGLDGASVRSAFDTTGVYEIVVDGTTVRLDPDDLEIRAEEHDEMALTQDGAYAVALDLTLDDELRLEGTARELVRALNDQRKAIGLAIADRIHLTIQAPGMPGEAMRRHGDWIASEVLATEWRLVDDAMDSAVDTAQLQTITVEGQPVGVHVKVVAPG